MVTRSITIFVNHSRNGMYDAKTLLTSIGEERFDLLILFFD